MKIEGEKTAFITKNFIKKPVTSCQLCLQKTQATLIGFLSLSKYNMKVLIPYVNNTRQKIKVYFNICQLSI